MRVYGNMKEFNVLDPLQLYSYLDTVLRTTKELCLDDEGIEFDNKIYYTPLIHFNSLDIVLTNLEYNSSKPTYTVKFYYRDPHVDLSNNFVFAIHLKQEELNNLEIIKQKFIEASKKYLLEKDQESIQKVINKLASKLNKKSIDHILNKDCNGILFNFDSNELYLIEDCDDLLENI